MKYLQTDDRDDYFDSLKKKYQRPRKYFTLKKNGELLIQKKEKYQIRGYLKNINHDLYYKLSFASIQLPNICKAFGFEFTKEEEIK